MEKKVLELVQKINPFEDIDYETLLIEEGVLDSLSLVVLIGLLEEEFEIRILEDNLFVENFINIKAIVNLIKTYQ